MISARTALSLEWGLSGGAVMGRDPTSASDIKETLGLAVLKVSPALEECKSRILYKASVDSGLVTGSPEWPRVPRETATVPPV